MFPACEAAKDCSGSVLSEAWNICGSEHLLSERAVNMCSEHERNLNVCGSEHVLIEGVLNVCGLLRGHELCAQLHSFEY